MRRMATTKQLDYINDLSEVATFENNNRNIRIENINVEMSAHQEDSNTTVASVQVIQSGNVELSADTECAIYGHYSEDDGDYLYKLGIGEAGIQLQTLDRYSSGDYVSRLIINQNGILLLLLPELDPKVEGALWNDNGVLKISSGQ